MDEVYDILGATIKSNWIKKLASYLIPVLIITMSISKASSGDPDKEWNKCHDKATTHNAISECDEVMFEAVKKRLTKLAGLLEKRMQDDEKSGEDMTKVDESIGQYHEALQLYCNATEKVETHYMDCMINGIKLQGSMLQASIVRGEDANREPKKTAEVVEKKQEITYTPSERLTTAYRAMVFSTEGNKISNRGTKYHYEYSRSLQKTCEKSDQKCIDAAYNKQAEKLESMIKGDSKSTLQKAKEKLMSEILSQYNAMIDHAWNFVPNSNIVPDKYKSMRVLCKAIDSLKHPHYHLEERYHRKCGEELENKKGKLVESLLSGEIKPENCFQVALMNGDKWLNATDNSAHKTFGNNKGITKFKGTLRSMSDGDDGETLYVQNAKTESMLIIENTDKSIVLNEDLITLGKTVSGYANKYTTAAVTLVNGGQQTISVATIGCIQ